jgi:hypothetical protein
MECAGIFTSNLIASDMEAVMAGKVERESGKKHGGNLDELLKQVDEHRTGAGSDPVPMPESGGHEKSHAAHLGGGAGTTGHEHTKPAGTLLRGAGPGELKEPPVVSRGRGQHR